MSPAGLRASASAPAKTNLALHVGDPTPDGYHPLETLFIAVDVRETVTASVNTHVARRGSGVMVTVSPAPGSEYAEMIQSGTARLSDIPLDDSNLAVRAALAVSEAHGDNPGIELRIDKAVPVAGGMGGGSADAAAALVAVDALLAKHLDQPRLGRHRLMNIGSTLGADVPFMILGGLAEGRGKGDDLRTVETDDQLHLVFVPQDQGLATPAVFRQWDHAHRVHTAHRSQRAPDPLNPALVRAAAIGDAPGVATWVRNDLQSPALELLPELATLLNHGVDLGALAGWVSGSGPTVCFLAESAEAAENLVNGLRREHRHAFSTTGPVVGAQLIPEWGTI
ncbi:4-(cytidine 5'-diphospho)-2-C-methyl-D-erythritol kinase [Kocuria sp. WRN011]|uniref:4-(cytidine 5'-diphospho)-2-C-methyl-D-erythritol kinase n=1 Tax=Kocuria TaxID=57493 RepID=UPI000BB05B22|nr:MULTISPECIES: 4-(cytidine 5'-diphospho)-2-C-methyl-D-erythritol kinase [Kocuria]MCT1801724.1 4-(cytidine 5'-diphospho)-2-C-methyl-D-erythritol kinase [Kocuria carniphila]PBB09329.1 4-(cytidine 5'-diphospho)-2-C-methyl-D-erythritol kinase [Kocuria sp. WRN011]